MSFRRRLALLIAGAVALVGATVGASVYVVVRAQLGAQVEREMHAAAEVVRSAVLATGGLPGVQGPAAARPPNIPRIIDADGNVVETRSPQLEFPVTPQARSVAAGALGSSLQTVAHGVEQFRVLTVPLDGDQALQILQSFAPADDALRALLRTSLLAVGSIVLVAPLIGYVVAGGALVPVRRLSRTAERVARTADLGERAEVRAGNDELASLARSFNAMLDRLEGVVDALEGAQRAQRQLVADASHELRTPLTTLRTNVEFLSLEADLAAADRDSLAADTLAQIDDLGVLMGQLIDLAREDEREPERTPVRFDRVIEDVLDRTRQHYPAVLFTAELEPTVVRGTPGALSTAVGNLLDNAGKWSSAGAPVEIHLGEGTLSIRDHGPGIDEADLPHVFQRFYRGRRTRSLPGSGLGLAIVGRIVASHGGQAWAEAAPGGGTLFKVRLPTNGS